MTKNINSNEALANGIGSGTGAKKYLQSITVEELLDDSFDKFVAAVDAELEQGKDLPSPRTLYNKLGFAQREEVIYYNADKDKDHTFQKPAAAHWSYIARLMIRYDHVVMLSMTDAGVPAREDATLAIYCQEGEHEGTYTFDEHVIGARIDAYSDKLTKGNFELVWKYLERHAPLVRRTTEPDLVPVNNGILNYATKELYDFSPDYYYTTKSTTNYVDGAPNVYITMPDGEVWDCDYQMESMASDEEQLTLHWQMISGALRPFATSLDKAIFPYSETGCNGKGTLCSIITNIVGEDACSSLSLKDMAENDFALTDVRRGKTCIIGHENPVGTYIDQSASFKSLVSSDPIWINQKYKTPISITYFGTVIQCLNELPKVRDRSNSFLRRVIFDPFTSEFEGVERPYIKKDYLKRPEVLEYFLYKALNMDFDEYILPKVCQEAMEHYKCFNDPIREFWNDVEDELVWNVQPSAWLFELYKAWFSETHPNGTAVSKNVFWQQLTMVINKDKWTVCNDQRRRNKEQDEMGEYEPLINAYQVEKYYSPALKGSVDLEKRASFVRPDKLRQRLERK